MSAPLALLSVGDLSGPAAGRLHFRNLRQVS